MLFEQHVVIIVKTDLPGDENNVTIGGGGGNVHVPSSLQHTSIRMTSGSADAAKVDPGSPTTEPLSQRPCDTYVTYCKLQLTAVMHYIVCFRLFASYNVSTMDIRSRQLAMLAALSG